MPTWDEFKAIKESMQPTALESKDAYLAWVIHWKERYKWISAEIRAMRQEHGAGRTWLSPTAHEWHMLRLEGKQRSWRIRCEELAYEMTECEGVAYAEDSNYAAAAS